MNDPASPSDTALNPELDHLKREFLAGVPEATKQTLMHAARTLADSRLAEGAVNRGAPAPDFELPNALGAAVRLSAQYSRGPVVLSFYRGGWCPYCNLELAALQRSLPAIQALGATLLAVSPQTPDRSLTTAERLALGFEVLSDVGHHVARRYGLVFTVPEALRPIYRGWEIDLPAWNGETSWELPLPATYVIDRSGTVHSAHVDADYTQRMEPADILAALRTIDH